MTCTTPFLNLAKWLQLQGNLIKTTNRMMGHRKSLVREPRSKALFQQEIDIDAPATMPPEKLEQLNHLVPLSEVGREFVLLSYL